MKTKHILTKLAGYYITPAIGFILRVGRRPLRPRPTKITSTHNQMKAYLEQEASYKDIGGGLSIQSHAIINIGGLGGNTFTSALPKDETEAKVINTDARLLVLAFNSI